MDLEIVKKRLTPAKEPKQPKSFLNKLNKLLTNAEAVLGGSWAKGTYLPNDHDIDIFIQCKTEEDMKQLPSILDELGDIKTIHGSRDYYQILQGTFVYEIVPVLTIDNPEDAKNTTDLSPLHVDFVKQHSEVVGDIRLAKQFCKSAKLYGAESYINGFSGHVVDLLIIYYGSFMNLLKAASRWHEGIVIDPLRKLTDASSLNNSKHGPLILIDPIQRERNAAAALSKVQFHKFITRAQAFLENPSEDFFTVKPLSKEEIVLLKPDKPRIIYELKSLEGNKDVVGTKLLKAHEHLIYQAKQAGFTVIAEGFEFIDTALGYIIVSEEPLSENMERIGPPLSAQEDVQRFKNTHATTWEKDGHLWATVKRSFTTLDELFLTMKRLPYMAQRIQDGSLVDV